MKEQSPARAPVSVTGAVALGDRRRAFGRQLGNDRHWQSQWHTFTIRDRVVSPSCVGSAWVTVEIGCCPSFVLVLNHRRVESGIRFHSYTVSRIGG